MVPTLRYSSSECSDSDTPRVRQSSDADDTSVIEDEVDLHDNENSGVDCEVNLNVDKGISNDELFVKTKYGEQVSLFVL